MRKFRQTVDRVSFEFPVGKKAMTLDALVADALANAVNDGGEYYCTLPDKKDGVEILFYCDGKPVKVDCILLQIEYTNGRPKFVEKEVKPKGGGDD